MAESLCDTCPKPGACCRGLALRDADTGKEATFWQDLGREAPLAWCRERGLPFVPTRVSGMWTDPATGRDFVTWIFECPELTAEGRCAIYSARPEVCRRLEVGVSEFCVLSDDYKRFHQNG